MTTQSVPISSNGRDLTMDIDNEDVSSVATPPIGYRNSSEDHAFVSKMIRFYFAPFDQSQINRVHPSDIHSQWIRIIQSAFGDDVKIINNANRPVKNLDTSVTANGAFAYAQQFKVHTKMLGNSPTTGAPKSSQVIIHRILTRVPLGQIKRHINAYQLLTNNHCYLNEHLWDEQEWDLQQIGFVTGFNPKYYSNERVTAMFRTRLIKATPRKKIPKFQMVLKSHRIDHNGRKSNTQAYAIEVPTHAIPQLIPLLKEATNATKEFVTFQMRRRNPEAFQGAIRYQNHLLSNQYVIVIDCVGKEAMYYISDRIKAISGVIDVVPARKVESTGRYLIIVNKENIQNVRNKLSKKFDQWYNEVVPDDAKPKPEQYGGIPEIRTPRSDGFSEGDHSWMTNSTKSFMSFSVASMPSTGTAGEADQDLDRAWEIPAATSESTNDKVPHTRSTRTTYTSYAAATAGSDQVSGITDSEPSPRDVKHEELSLKIASLEAMIIALCAQVQALTPQSTQFIDSPPSKTRDLCQHQENRQDTKSSPRKSKRTHDQSADSVAEEGSQESAHQTEDRRTAWDDYSTSDNNE